MITHQELDAKFQKSQVANPEMYYALKKDQERIKSKLPKHSVSIETMGRIGDYVNGVVRVKNIDIPDTEDHEKIFSLIKEIVLDITGLDEQRAFSRDRKQMLVAARMVIAFLTRVLTKLSLSKIADRIEGSAARDHSTIISMCKRMVIAYQSKDRLTYGIYQKTLLRLRSSGIYFYMDAPNQPSWLVNMLEGKKGTVSNKLTKKQITEINKIKEDYSIGALSEMYDVSRDQLSKIINTSHHKHTARHEKRHTTKQVS